MIFDASARIHSFSLEMLTPISIFNQYTSILGFPRYWSVSLSVFSQFVFFIQFEIENVCNVVLYSGLSEIWNIFDQI